MIDAALARLAYIATRLLGGSLQSAQRIMLLEASAARMRFAQRVARRDVTREVVESNTTNALKMRGNWNAADRLTERRAVIRLMARSLQESGSKACVVKAWANNTVTALTVEGGF